MKGGRPFCFAAIWEPESSSAGDGPGSCAVLTVPANALVRPFNGRMPAILDAGEYETWLDPTVTDLARLRRLLRPYRAEAMEARPASDVVNDPRHEGADCLASAPRVLLEPS
jgi:putative SOS response-associated peptidase YedK